MNQQSNYRLCTSPYHRPDNLREPKKILFLSVEGECTEVDYFENVERFILRSNDDYIVRIEVLHRKRGDGHSAPRQVLELLDEYIELREGELVPDDILKDFISQYSKKTINDYLADPTSVNCEVRNSIENSLLLVGIDFNYRYYLHNLQSREDDRFVVIIDRDASCSSHSPEIMLECIQKARDRKYECYITNPCFDFWLLLHISDVKIEYVGEYEKLAENENISKQYSYIGYELRKKTGNKKKSLSPSIFENYYLSNIQLALQRCKDFCIEPEMLLENIGSNLAGFFNGINLQ